MTQSGQGEEPSARVAHEGIVLPSDGGDPLLPGTTGDRTVPAGGQAWGQPWGPEQPAAPAPQQGQGWGAPEHPAPPAPSGAPAQTHGTPEPPGSTAPAPDWGTLDTSQGWAAQAPAPGWNAAPAQQQAPHAADQGHQQGLPPLPQAAPAPQLPSGAGPLPPEGAQPPAYGSGGALLPPAVDGATQYIPHIPPAAAPGDEGATQYIPPVAAGPDEGATQFIAPVGPGALPPEIPAEATQFLGRAPQGGAGAQGGGAGPLPPAANPDSEATQYIAPVPAQPGAGPYGIRPGAPEDRQPPAEFDNLFRSSEPEGPASTQQMPRFEPPAPQGVHAPGAPGAPGGRAAARRGASDGSGGGGGRGGRTGSRVPLIAAVGVGIVVLGIGAGSLLSGGDGSGKDSNNKTVSATGPAADSSSSAATDPAKAQAVALDKLLADSNNSRATVIKAVADIKVCNNLDQAASDLRDAAKQRGDLVTRLAGLSVDKLANHAALTSALTSAWKASASADNHYAAWADQVNGNKGCKKGHARTTGQVQAGNRASGTASAQKVKAAQLWNAIASTYGLTQRQPTQL